MKPRGWEFLYVAIDDHSRLAFSALLPEEKAVSPSAFCQAIADCTRHGITIRRVLTDNGPCFCSQLFLAVCRQFHITPKRTRSYTPRTNGKAERFIQTAIRERAYARLYRPSACAISLPGFTSTTGIDLTPASTSNRPSADPV